MLYVWCFKHAPSHNQTIFSNHTWRNNSAIDSSMMINVTRDSVISVFEGFQVGLCRDREKKCDHGFHAVNHAFGVQSHFFKLKKIKQIPFYIKIGQSCNWKKMWSRFSRFWGPIMFFNKKTKKITILYQNRSKLWFVYT